MDTSQDSALESDSEKKGYSSGPEAVPVSSVESKRLQQHHLHKQENDLDSAALLSKGVTITPEQSKAIRWKIDCHLMPLMCAIYLIQFMDKTTLGNSVLLGVKPDNHLTTVEYNVLSTIFYVSYLLFEWPQSVGLQKYPVGKYMAINIISWAIILMLHAACSNFAGLFVVRFLLGIAEGSITAGFMIVTSQFYNKVEQGQRVGIWFLMNGTAQCSSGLISYGIHHIYGDIAQWKILFLLTGAVTLVLGIVWWFYFPDSVTTAWFLTPEERGMAIERVRENQTGIENKHWKRYQFIEALTDVKVWLFVWFSFFDNVPNALTNQNSTIYLELGFSTLTSTLLGIPSGVIEIITIGTGVYLLGRFPNSRGIISIIYFVPNILGSVLVIALPFENKIGILVCLYITGFGTTGFVICLAWLQATTAGHTKKTTAMGMNLIGYCIGNIVGPQLFQPQYAPRNIVPWAVIIACYSIAPVLLAVILYLLKKENAKRDQEALRRKEDGIEEEEVWVDVVHADGRITVEKVDKNFLDLTDKENRDFRYCL